MRTPETYVLYSTHREDYACYYVPTTHPSRPGPDVDRGLAVAAVLVGVTGEKQLVGEVWAEVAKHLALAEKENLLSR